MTAREIPPAVKAAIAQARLALSAARRTKENRK